MEEQIISLLKSLEDQGKISEKEKTNLYPSSCKPRVRYRLAKIHKSLKGEIPSFRPILSAIGTTSYKLAKFGDQLLKLLTINEYTIKEYFSFAKEVLEFDALFFMASFNRKLLFANISNGNVKPLCKKPLHKSNTCCQID